MEYDFTSYFSIFDTYMAPQAHKSIFEKIEIFCENGFFEKLSFFGQNGPNLTKNDQISNLLKIVSIASILILRVWERQNLQY